MSARIDRFSPVRLEVLYALPTGSAKLFMIAAAEGRSMNPAGTFDKMGAGQVPIGVWVGETHRDRILGTLKLSLSRWRYAVRQWVDAGLAHHCELNGLFLFMKPELECRRCLGVQSSYAPAFNPVTPHFSEIDALTNERGDIYGEEIQGMGVGEESEVEGSKPSEVQEVPALEGSPKSRRDEIALDLWKRMHPDEQEAQP